MYSNSVYCSYKYSLSHPLFAGKESAFWATEAWTGVHTPEAQIYQVWGNILFCWCFSLFPFSDVFDIVRSHCLNTFGWYLWVYKYSKEETRCNALHDIFMHK